MKIKMKITLLLAFSTWLSCTTFADEPQNTHNMGSFVRQQKGESQVSPTINEYNLTPYENENENLSCIINILFCCFECCSLHD